MKYSLLLFASVLMISGLLSPGYSQDKPMTLDDRVSYAYGTVVARDLKQRGIPINEEQFLEAFKRAMTDQSSLLSDDEIGLAFDQNQLRLDEQNASPENRANLMAGKKFLAENAKKEGIKVTSRGLQYKVLKEGDGAKPIATDKVRVNYHGTLIDGTVFDSSVDRGEPIAFELNKVIPGWTYGVQLMSVGSKYRFFIPYNLAYGEAAAGTKIKPYSALIFDIELLAIK